MNLASALFDSLWFPPPERLILESGAVHVWRARLNQSPMEVRRLQDALAIDERSRAERFYFRHDRERFIVARGILRTILGRYLDRAPESLSFGYGPYGKPALVSDAGPEEIRFNISHSHGMVLYVVTRGPEIGVDLELVRDGLDIEEIAEKFFSHAEIAALYALPVQSEDVPSFSVGLARRPTSRPEEKVFRCRSTNSKYRLCPESPPY